MYFSSVIKHLLFKEVPKLTHIKQSVTYNLYTTNNFNINYLQIHYLSAMNSSVTSTSRFIPLFFICFLISWIYIYTCVCVCIDTHTHTQINCSYAIYVHIISVINFYFISLQWQIHMIYVLYIYLPLLENSLSLYFV